MGIEKQVKDQKVRVGKKSKSDYVASALYSLDKFNFTILEGLGRWKGKVLDVSERLEEITNATSGSPQMINVDGVAGLRIKVKKRGSDRRE